MDAAWPPFCQETIMTLTRLGCVSVLALLLCISPAVPQEKGRDEVSLKVVKYDELCDIITKQRGKVVLIDFFTDNCPPCKAAFPGIVELNRKYAGKGLVTISVALDPWEAGGFRKEMPEVVLNYLKKKDALFTN